MSGGQRIAAFVVLAFLFLIGSFVVALLKMLRSSDMPLWTHTDPVTRQKTHGFLNWWGTLFAIGVGVDGILFGALPTIIQAVQILVGMFGTKAAG